MKSVGGKNRVGFLTVSACVGLGVLLSAAAFGQGRAASGSEQQKIAEAIYLAEDGAYSSHDIANIVSFFDPTYVFVAPDGKRMSYAEWRKGLSAGLAQVRHS